jgi:hypothetical protein
MFRRTGPGATAMVAVKTVLSALQLEAEEHPRRSASSTTWTASGPKCTPPARQQWQRARGR